MSVSDSFSRFAAYYTRYGFWATVRRARRAVERALFFNREALFYCEPSRENFPEADFQSSLKVERKKIDAELSPEDLEAMTRFWNPRLARRYIEERFSKGASLWLIKFEGRLAGYGWTLVGRTIEPHYFPLGQDDVHLFDFHVFPQYRGRGLNPYLVTQILCNLAADRAGRAYIEAAEWNQAQLSSLSKTPFRRLGLARKLSIFGRTIVSWSVIEALKDRHGEPVL